MKLTDIRSFFDSAPWEEKGYQVSKFDLDAVRAKTRGNPTWLHFGAGNIFRAFPAAVLQKALDNGNYDRGVIVAEGFDYEIIDKAYRPFDNKSLLVLLKSDGTLEKRVVASVGKAACSTWIGNRRQGGADEGLYLSEPSAHRPGYLRLSAGSYPDLRGNAGG